jgi:hypothetical protein
LKECLVTGGWFRWLQVVTREIPCITIMAWDSSTTSQDAFSLLLSLKSLSMLMNFSSEHATWVDQIHVLPQEGLSTFSGVTSAMGCTSATSLHTSRHAGVANVTTHGFVRVGIAILKTWYATFTGEQAYNGVDFAWNSQLVVSFVPLHWMCRVNWPNTMGYTLIVNVNSRRQSLSYTLRVMLYNNDLHPCTELEC